MERVPVKGLFFTWALLAVMQYRTMSSNIFEILLKNGM